MNEASSFWEDAVFVERDEVHEHNEENIIAQDDDTIASIRSWLQPTDFNSEGSEYQKHLLSHLSGTGAWVSASSIYQQWHESSKHGLLWVRGIPGSGKSVLAAKAVHNLLQERAPVLYFFFRQIVDANHRPRAALQDWLTQVLPYSPPLQLQLKTYIDDSGGQLCRLDSVSMSDLWQHLRTALAHMSKAYLVVDALDEMDQGPEADAFVQSLSDLARWRPSQVKVLMTSRPVANVKRSLSGTAILRLKMDEGNVDRDISAYVRARLEHSEIPLEYYSPIQAAVPGRAKGLFLYAKLAMDALLKDGVDISQALGEIPENLSQMYTQLLSQHAARSGVSVDEQQLILKWMTHSVRSLRLIELADVLSHQHTLIDRNLGAAKGILRLACGSLLELLPDETLCVVHHSLTEFLRGEVRTGMEEYPILEPLTTHHQLALMCLSYLQNGCLQDGEPQPPSRHNPFAPAPAKPLLAPFAKYAAVNWSTHVLQSGEDGVAEMNSALDKFTTHTHFQTWAHVAGLRKDARDVTTPISMAIGLGLSDYLRHLLERSDVHVNEGAPIVSAAARGFTDVVDLLVKSGANVDQYDAGGYTALHRAAMNNHPAIMTLLLQAGCNIDLATTTRSMDSGFSHRQCRASWFACDRGHIEALAELQKCMTTLDQVGYALRVSVERKRTYLVRQLLEHRLMNSNPHENLRESSEADGGTLEERRNALLVLACDNRDLDTIELLLAAGADANARALHALARSKARVDPETATQCFAMIIGAGVDLNAPDYGSNSPLHYAADAIAAKMLLEAGADIESHGQDEETPVFTCASVEVLKVLVEVGGANLEKRNRDGRTPLLASMYRSLSTRKDEKAILALIDLGADASAVDNEGNGVFHYAIKEFSSEFPQGLIERFCAAGADINRVNNLGEAPIHLTKIEIRKGFGVGDFPIPRRTPQFETLVAAGARLATTAADVSKDPLFKWISNSICDAHDSHLADVKETLIKYGATLDVVDDEGRTLLHAAVTDTRHKAHMIFLLEQGLDPQAVDYKGNTLWHEAASHLAGISYTPQDKPAEPFEQLTQMDINPMQPNHLGRIPLHILSALWPCAIHDFKRSSRAVIGAGHAEVETAFDMMLSLSPEVDIVDKEGVTPLHLASTLSEFLVGRLLSRGADPSRVTKEGCNVIHLAARAAKPNIVGMLLAVLRSKSISALVSAANARDHLGRSPLYYACLAGSYESAQFLVEAGATVDIEDYSTSPWRAIARFEVQSLNYSSRSGDKKVGSVLIAHDGESADKRIMYFGKERLDELVALLLANSMGSMSIIDQSILDAASFDADYTVERLLEARNAAHLGEYNAVDGQVTASIARIRVKREDLGKPCKNCSKAHYKSPLQAAMILNDHRSLPDALVAEEDKSYQQSTLRNLVSSGNASAIRHVVKLHGPQVLDDRSWGQQDNVQRRHSYQRPEDVEPLLLKACRGAVPHLDTIRVLVEQAQHNINIQQQATKKKEAYYSGLTDSGGYVEGECALHALVRGEHWWHVNQGLRYFLERGADTELRDVHGMTPLNAALNRCGWLIFDRTAVKLLVQHGADVNTVDRMGHSCLAKACSDPEMARLLLDRGAVVTQRVLIQAIELMDPDLLTLLLSRGGDPNIRGESERAHSISSNGRYPLHHAIVEMNNRHHSNKADQEKFRSMITVLLDHGANPSAAYDSTTILHELLRGNEALDQLFTLSKSKFNINVRNAAGETPLHLACQGRSLRRRSSDSDKPSTLRLLISHGADIRSQDNEGNTIWHIFSKTGSYGYSNVDLQSLFESAPNLINTPNKAGVTPLHAAISHISRSPILNFLLDNGGNLHALDRKGNSLLHCLLRNDWTVHNSRKVKGISLPFFTRLLAAGLDVNHRNEEGETPVFNFFRHSKVGPCNCGRQDLFATRKAKVQAKAKEQPGVEEQPKARGHENAETPASPRYTLLDQYVYDIFTRAGVDWHAESARKQNVLHIIAGLAKPENDKRLRDLGQGGLAAKFKALMDMGVNAGLEDVEGRTPVDVAAELGYKDILELFQEG
ncbi:ankyrin repeat-containing domain protein, partial [Boeremia exigua]|uniref:ankyrin repeat-containing domain protein n=1 Tax=Boeremia exigua TaxID=749465 RepID=UPI001E8D8DD0